jgi:hypothetical protein
MPGADLLGDLGVRHQLVRDQRHRVRHEIAVLARHHLGVNTAAVMLWPSAIVCVSFTSDCSNTWWTPRWPTLQQATAAVTPLLPT